VSRVELERSHLGEVSAQSEWRGRNGVKINRSHTHRQRTTPSTQTHTHDKNNTPNPQTNTTRRSERKKEIKKQKERFRFSFVFGLTSVFSVVCRVELERIHLHVGQVELTLTLRPVLAGLRGKEVKGKDQ